MIDLPVFYRRDEIVVQFDYKRAGYSMLPRRHGILRAPLCLRCKISS